MALIKKFRFFLCLTAIGFPLVIYFSKVYDHLRERRDFAYFNNVTGLRTLLVPNLVHFVNFDQPTLSFVSFVCVLSAYYHHKPKKIYFHTNIERVGGRYFDLLSRALGDTLKVHKLAKPTHVYGQKLSSVQHSADVAKIKILMRYGGIALDQDTYVIKDLNRYRHFECAVGWPRGQNMGSQVLVAHKDARFLPLYLATYKDYRPTMWYYNAGEAPTKNVLAAKPELVHRVYTEFGVENLLEELYNKKWEGWVNKYTIHLLYRHREYLNEGKSPVNYDEHNYKSCQCTFSQLVEQIMQKLSENGIQLKSLQKVESSTPAVVPTQNHDDEVRRFMNSDSRSLLHKFLNIKLYKKLKSVVTSRFGASLYDQIKSGLMNHGSAVGVYATDAEAYESFDALFRPIIKDYHGVDGKLAHPASDWGGSLDLGTFKYADSIVSTRIRVARSLEGFPFNSKMNASDYSSVEALVRSAIAGLSESEAGQYIPLSEMAPDDQERLVSDHLMFGTCDKYLVASGACRHWPQGRGLFLSRDRHLALWVNEEDHLRVISIDEGGNLSQVYTRLVNFMKSLEKSLRFAHSSQLGYLTFCPTNLGTGLRASVMVKLPQLIKHNLLEAAASKYGLQIRGQYGEHTQIKDGTVELSNMRRLGLTEVEAVKTLFAGVDKLLMLENGDT